MDTAEILANYKSIEKYIFGWASSVFTEFNEFQKTKKCLLLYRYECFS